MGGNSRPLVSFCLVSVTCVCPVSPVPMGNERQRTANPVYVRSATTAAAAADGGEAAALERGKKSLGTRG